MKSNRLKNFLPSQNGFRFGNHFQSHLTMFFIDDAAGMCGGMVFAVRDYHESKLLPPSRSQVPTQTDEKNLLDYIRQRQWDSVLQTASMNYFLGPVLRANTCCQSILQAYQKIKNDIDNNHLSILGLLRTYNIMQVSQNHQVGVYGYEEDEVGNVKLFIYDPKYPSNDAAAIMLNITLLCPENYLNNATPISCTPSTIGPIYMFFQPNYTLKFPVCGILQPETVFTPSELQEGQKPKS